MLLAAVVFLSIALSFAAGETRAQKKIDTVVVETASGKHKFFIELADAPGSRARGLMFRRKLAADHGMLFHWRKAMPIAMWMKNTYISLDMIFIETDGTVARVAENAVPHSLEHIASGKPVSAVLEVVAGTAKRINLKSGDKVRHRVFSNQAN